MRRRVDATRQPAHDDDAGGRQIGGERRGDLEPLARRGAGADDRHEARRAEHLGLAAQPQDRRRVGDLAQRRRVGRRSDRHGALPGGDPRGQMALGLAQSDARAPPPHRRARRRTGMPRRGGSRPGRAPADRRVSGIGRASQWRMRRAEQPATGVAEHGQGDGLEVGHGRPPEAPHAAAANVGTRERGGAVTSAGSIIGGCATARKRWRRLLART